MDFSFSTRRWIEPGEPAGASHGFALGLHPREFYGKVIDIGACSIQFPGADAILASVRRLALAHGLEAWDAKLHTGLLRHLVLRASRATGAILVNLVTAAEAPERIGPFARELLAAHPEITTLVQNLHASPALAALSERELVLHGPGTIVERVAGLDFRLSAHSFFQTNTAQAETLFRIVGEEAAPAPSDVVYDLYCGAGAFALLLARRARSAWVSRSSSPPCATRSRTRAPTEIANAHFRCVDLGRPLPEDADRAAGRRRRRRSAARRPASARDRGAGGARRPRRAARGLRFVQPRRRGARRAPARARRLASRPRATDRPLPAHAAPGVRADPGARAVSGPARPESPQPRREPDRSRAGLCPRCVHVHLVRNDRGSTFLMCKLAKDDPRFAKYPPQPVVSCAGFSG
jgi:hypothetical protein